MKIGIIGLPQTGKKTLFKLLTQTESLRDDQAKGSLMGIAIIRDPRFDLLVDSYKPKKSLSARIDVALLPKIVKDSIAQGTIFKEISDMNAICHVVRAFVDDAIYHVSGEINPGRDIKAINDELIMYDLIFIEKRMEKIVANKDKAERDSLDKEKTVLLKLKQQLEKELPLRLLDLEKEELKNLASYPLLTLKEMVVLLNIGENDLKDELLLKRLKEKFASFKVSFMQACLKTESEIAAFDSVAEREEFLIDLGITESALDCLARLCLKALGLISFFTVVSGEVRQWTIKAGSSVLDAAGTIHTDLARGFIRAEVLKFADLETFGSEEKAKNAGRLYVKGKDYIVEDGDIIKIRFNV